MIGFDIPFDEFMKDHVGIVNTMKHKYRGTIGVSRTVSEDDIAQLATLGVYKAYLLFDHSKGYKFSTLGFRSADVEILRALRRDNAVAGMKYPVESMRICNVWLRPKSMHEITTDFLAYVQEQEGVTDYMMEGAYNYYVARYARGTLSIDAPAYTDDNSEITFGDFIVDPSGEIEVKEVPLIVRFRDTLEGRDVIIYDSLANGIPQSVLGKQLGISQAQVSRLRKKMYSKYKAFAKEEEDKYASC